MLLQILPMRRRISMILVLGIAAACAAPDAPPSSPKMDAVRGDAAVPMDELYKVLPDSVILKAARALMLADSNVAVVTVDSMGQPRVRTTKAFVSAAVPGDPAKGVTVWIMTRLGTRKVEQMRKHPQVTLYFNSDERVEYATIMGTAVIHTDAENPEAKAFYENGYAEFFWPDFPKDFVMIEVKPRWLEYLGPAVAAHPETWRPQGVVF